MLVIFKPPNMLEWRLDMQLIPIALEIPNRWRMVGCGGEMEGGEEEGREEEWTLLTF